MKTMMAIAVAAALATMGMIEGVARAEPAPATTACATHEASIYFERDRSDVTPASQLVIAKLAAEARNCGSTRIVTEIPSGPQQAPRANAIAAAFAARRVNAVSVAAAGTAGEDSMRGRSVALRIELAPTVLAQLN